MTTAFQARTTIDHPRDRVWRTLTDWEHADSWMPGITDPEADGPTAVGMTLRFESRGRAHESRVVACEPEHLLVLRSEQGGVTADYEYRLTADATATLVELSADVSTTGAWTLLAPVIRRAIRRADGGQLAELARAVAASAAPG